MARTAKLKDIKKQILEDLRWHVEHTRCVPWELRTPTDFTYAAAHAVKDKLTERLLATQASYHLSKAKRAYYLSIEYLPGMFTFNNLVNMGLSEVCEDIFREEGINLTEFVSSLPDPALGNGGLGRLASCYMESMASLGLPGMGYGILYEVGLFKQAIEHGEQVEKPDFWMSGGDPNLIARYGESVTIEMFGRVENRQDAHGNWVPCWVDTQRTHGTPYDVPIAGHGGKTVNILRLYKANASRDFNMGIFNMGDYLKAVEDKVYTETISKVLYPREDVSHGRLLRLVQEYFLVACSLSDIIRRHLSDNPNLDNLAGKAAIQLNDTHPSLAIPELMRILVDKHGYAWEQAWEITTQTISYTNHTLMPEALEMWPVELLNHVLPRHLQIIYEINRRFLEVMAARYPDEPLRLRRASLISEDNGKKVRMGHLSVVGSHSVNGVSRLHSDLVKSLLFPDYAELWPEKFNNKTNGVTPRQWLLKANPRLCELIDNCIGEGWITNLERLRELEPHVSDSLFKERLIAVKRGNKQRLCSFLEHAMRLKLPSDALFDVQAKRIHEYKRQLLNCLHIIYEYLCIAEDGKTPLEPRVHLFAGKAAPGYFEAKQIIRLIHDLGQTINHDERVKGCLKVAFLPDYRVSLAEILIPAADLSEQISTAGTEASGTGNMKFALNGALTIGTYDGANIEMAEEVGEDNIYIFGLRVKEVQELISRKNYDPWGIYNSDERVRRVLDALRNGRICPEEPERYRWLFDKLLWPGEPYLHLADFGSYLDAQQQVSQDYANQSRWSEMAGLNVARMGKFSSDRAIKEYASEIWKVEPVLK